MLAMISEAKGEKTAFAFVDEGSFGESGLEAMRTPGNKKAKIFFLDCVGADAPLHVIGNDVSQDEIVGVRVLIINRPTKESLISSVQKLRKKKKRRNFYLDKADLDRKNIKYGKYYKSCGIVQIGTGPFP